MMPMWWIISPSEKWHTIVNFIFQSDPKLQMLIESGEAPHKVLETDTQFNNFIQTWISSAMTGRILVE
jgi:hypothetical protein